MDARGNATNPLKPVPPPAWLLRQDTVTFNLRTFPESRTYQDHRAGMAAGRPGFRHLFRQLRALSTDLVRAQRLERRPARNRAEWVARSEARTAPLVRRLCFACDVWGNAAWVSPYVCRVAQYRGARHSPRRRALAREADQLLRDLLSRTAWRGVGRRPASREVPAGLTPRLYQEFQAAIQHAWREWDRDDLAERRQAVWEACDTLQLRRPKLSFDILKQPPSRVAEAALASVFAIGQGRVRAIVRHRLETIVYA